MPTHRSRSALLAVLFLLPALAFAGPKKKAKADEPAVDSAAAMKEARAAWDEMIRLSDAFDPKAFDYYSTSGLMKTRMVDKYGAEKDRQFAMGMLPPMAERLMDAAKAMDDTATYEDVTVAMEDDKVRIKAKRTAHAKCRVDPEYSALLANSEGRWLLVEEFFVTHAVSQCEPSAERAKKLLAAVVEGAGTLPRKLDEDLRLDGLTVDELTLTYEMTLVSIAGDVDARSLEAALEDNVRTSTCKSPLTKDALHHGATLVSAFSDASGKSLFEIKMAGDACER